LRPYAAAGAEEMAKACLRVGGVEVWQGRLEQL
jgi:hypothetical protein